METSPDELGKVPFTFFTAPVTSDTGIELTVVMADVPFPFTYPVKLVAPVPPLPTAIKPVTLAALPAISPVTFEPTIPAILPFVIAKSAMSSVAMLRSSILELLIAPVAINGAAAVPAKSPANCNLPLVVTFASGITNEEACASIYVLTAF